MNYLDAARSVLKATGKPIWFEDRKYRLVFGKLTQRSLDALLALGVARPDIEVEECFHSSYYSDKDVRLRVICHFEGGCGYVDADTTYSQLNAAPERVLDEKLREINEKLPTPRAWMAL